ncbi:MAG: hypothetical protein ACLU4Q_06040 [Streptococcus thermophilus]
MMVQLDTRQVDGVGTYTVASDGTVTFVPEKSFTGKAPAVTVVREDKNGTKASAISHTNRTSSNSNRNDSAESYWTSWLWFKQVQ